MLTPKARWGDSSRRLPSPGGGGSAHIERSENVRRGGVISQLGHRSKRKTVTPPRREFHSRRPRERARSSRPVQGRVKNKNAGGGKSPPRRCICRKNLRGVVAGDGLDLEIFLQAVFAPFAAVAGLLVAAERRGAVVRHALQVDVAGADPAADPAGSLDGVGGDVAGETIRRVVGDPHRIFL